MRDVFLIFLFMHFCPGRDNKVTQSQFIQDLQRRTGQDVYDTYNIEQPRTEPVSH